MRPIINLSPIASVAAALWLSCLAAHAAAASASPDDFVFGKVLSGAVLTHEFEVRNEGSAALKISRVQLTPPLVVTSMPAVVAAGSVARIVVRMDTAGQRGRYRGEIDVVWADEATPAVSFTVQGEIVPLVEISPAPVVFLAARRGEVRHVSVDIINHEVPPLTIEGVAHAQDRLTTTVDTIEEGRRFRLTLFLKPDGPPGKHSETILVRTSSERERTMEIVANTYLRERVYTFPDDVDFGTLSLSAIERDPALLTAAAQTLMVYQFGGSDFIARIKTMPSQLVVKSERGPQQDRYQNTMSLAVDRLTVGPIRGSIRIETNDPQFPELVVPVSGTIVP